MLWLCIPDNISTYFYSKYFSKLKDAKRYLSEHPTEILISCKIKKTHIIANWHGWIILDPSNNNFWWFASSVEAWKYKRNELKKKNAWKIGPFLIYTKSIEK